MNDPEFPPGWTPPPGTPLVTQADRWGWQRKAIRALAEILDAHPDLPQVAWTIGSTGALTALVNGLAHADEVRATFTAWQHALPVEDVREAPIGDTGITSLSCRAYYGSVPVALTARIYGPLPDDEEPVAGQAPGTEPAIGRRAIREQGSRPPAAGQRGVPTTTRQDRPQAGPLIPPRTPGGPHPTQHP